MSFFKLNSGNDRVELFLNTWGIGVSVTSKDSDDFKCFLITTSLDKPSRRFGKQEKNAEKEKCRAIIRTR
jgi:hypothetical protein